MEPVLSPVVHGKHVMCFTGWQLDRVIFSRNQRCQCQCQKKIYL